MSFERSETSAVAVAVEAAVGLVEVAMGACGKSRAACY